MQAPLVAAGVLSLVASAAAFIALPPIAPSSVQVAVPAQPDKLAELEAPGVHVPVTHNDPADAAAAAPVWGRKEMIAVARRDPALLLMMASAFLAALGNQVYSVRIDCIARPSFQLTQTLCV
jgi:hypothetical protein